MTTQEQTVTDQKSRQLTGSQLRNEIDRIFELQKSHRFQIAQTSAAERIAKLRRLLNAIHRRREDIHQALQQDFSKPAAETDLTEIFPISTEIKHTIRHLKRWMAPQRVSAPLSLLTTRSWIRYEPRGIVLIIAPWNYPFNLCMGPLVSAIAAGNSAIVKPSELAPHTSALLRQMLSEIFPEEEVAVFEGAVETATELLATPFDHIFFTGSPAIGKIVMKAAAEHLCSVTLELGGKSPVIIDESANLRDCAEKIAWGKYSNVGQTCIAPDYLFVPESKKRSFIKELKRAIEKRYIPDPRRSPDYARIISPRHHQRLEELLKQSLEQGAQVEIGGESDHAQRYLAPTVLSNVTPDQAVMKEEIFGPLLPIIPYRKLPEAIELINTGEKPLALYIFSGDKKNIDYILNNTASGGVCINEVLLHFLQLNLPFGGVNHSGIGNSHGFYGFRAFSHERAILRHHRWSPLKLLYPPYTPTVKRLIKLILKYL